MKLTPDQLRELFNEMELAELFNTKTWSRRFGISPRQVKRLRAMVRERLAARAPKGPVNIVVMAFNQVNAKANRKIVA